MKRTFLVTGLFLIISLVTFAQTIETGQFRANYETPGWNLHKGSGDRSFNINIRFTKEFTNPPEIVLGVTTIEAPATNEDGKPDIIRYDVIPTIVTKELMVLKVTVWAESRLLNIAGYWMAVEQP